MQAAWPAPAAVRVAPPVASRLQAGPGPGARPRSPGPPALPCPALPWIPGSGQRGEAVPGHLDGGRPRARGPPLRHGGTGAPPVNGAAAPPRLATPRPLRGTRPPPARRPIGGQRYATPPRRHWGRGRRSAGWRRAGAQRGARGGAGGGAPRPGGRSSGARGAELRSRPGSCVLPTGTGGSSASPRSPACPGVSPACAAADGGHGLRAGTGSCRHLPAGSLPASLLPRRWRLSPVGKELGGAPRGPRAGGGGGPEQAVADRCRAQDGEGMEGARARGGGGEGGGTRVLARGSRGRGAARGCRSSHLAQLGGGRRGPGGGCGAAPAGVVVLRYRYRYRRRLYRPPAGQGGRGGRASVRCAEGATPALSAVLTAGVTQPDRARGNRRRPRCPRVPPSVSAVPPDALTVRPAKPPAPRRKETGQPGRAPPPPLLPALPGLAGARRGCRRSPSSPRLPRWRAEGGGRTGHPWGGGPGGGQRLPMPPDGSAGRRARCAPGVPRSRPQGAAKAGCPGRDRGESDAGGPGSGQRAAGSRRAVGRGGRRGGPGGGGGGADGAGGAQTKV